MVDSLYTAIVLSAKPVNLLIPGLVVLGCVQQITTAAEMNDARLNAFAHVTTPYCFYLDDDDELPADYLSVLNECRAADVALAYTNELVHGPTGEFLRQAKPYDRQAHAQDAMFVHHLALMRTNDAQAAAQTAPRGDYWPEMTMFAQLAAKGAAHIDRVGYVWNKASGMHTWPATLVAQVASTAWAHRSIAP